MRKIQDFPLRELGHALPYKCQRIVNKQFNTVKPANSWDEYLENLI